MKSRMAEELRLKHQPVAVLFADEKPEGATQFQEGKWGCVVAMHNAATKGRTVAFSRKTYGCPGGGVGLGFGDQYATNLPDIDGFLSTGTETREGEHYFKTPEMARAFWDALPITDIPHEYVVFRPLADLADDETPELVNFYVNPDQLSAMVVLANYGRSTVDNVVVRMGAGCHTLCLIPYAEGHREPQRAVIGLFDITTRSKVDPDILSFSMPYRMFQEMEANVPGSFFEYKDWLEVRKRLG
ncbi:MAG TPA: DUF169 domain-containing protein [Armatimonadota bacterium]|jgi:uncharacterized protein (DUF169 family)